MSRKQKPKYSPEFRAEAVKLAKKHPDRPIAEIARELHMSDRLLNRWVNAANESDAARAAGKLTESERAELERLRKDNDRLRMERDFLKKATAFFAKESE
jgi:transposase